MGQIDFRMPDLDPVTQLLRAAWATCAVCGRPVDRMTATRDEARRVTVFTAHCHGATETTLVTDDVMEDAGGLAPGTAFAERPTSLEAG